MLTHSLSFFFPRILFKIYKYFGFYHVVYSTYLPLDRYFQTISNRMPFCLRHEDERKKKRKREKEKNINLFNPICFHSTLIFYNLCYIAWRYKYESCPVSFFLLSGNKQKIKKVSILVIVPNGTVEYFRHQKFYIR